MRAEPRKRKGEKSVQRALKEEGKRERERTKGTREHTAREKERDNDDEGRRDR